MTAKPEAPPELFVGVEWEHHGRTLCADIWRTEVMGIGCCLVRDFDYRPDEGWQASWDFDVDGSDYGSQEQASTWLRAKVIEARDELCKVTGTVAMPLPSVPGVE